MQGIFQKENTDKALKYGIYRHLPTYEKIIRNLVSFYAKIAGIFVPAILAYIKCYLYLPYVNMVLTKNENNGVFNKTQEMGERRIIH